MQVHLLCCQACQHITCSYAVFARQVTPSPSWYTPLLRDSKKDCLVSLGHLSAALPGGIA